MRKIRLSIRAVSAALCIMALPAEAIAAETSPTCLSAADVSALATFAMPSALTGLINNCATHVGANSYMATRGRELASAYALRKDAAWPRARQAFFRIAGEGKAGDAAMNDALAKMPDAALQPFVEGMIGTMVGAKLKPGQCVVADKLMRLLAPLPPENMAELVSTIIELADADKKPGGGFAICK